MKDNGELNIAYQRLARRIYKFQYLSLINAPKPILDGSKEMVNKARAYVDSLGAYDPNTFRKHLELAIIRQYAANTKQAKCSNCMTGDKYVLEKGRYCPKILVASDSAMPEIVELPFQRDADKECDEYTRVSFTGDLDAQILPEILSVLREKYGINKDFIYRHI